MLYNRSSALSPSLLSSDERKYTKPAFNVRVTITVILRVHHLALLPDEVKHGETVL